MFGKKSNANQPQSRIDSLIGPGTKLEGSVTFTGGLRVDGEIRGNISVEEGQTGTLVVSEQGRIEGEVSVTHLVINGTVVGPVAASDFLELQPSARVRGDVQYNSLEMHLGSVVEGRLIHQSTVSKSVELKLASSGS